MFANEKKFLQPGFTLIEILVTIGIIGLISTISIFSYNSIKSSQRDSDRVADVKKIALGLERYKSAHNEYPTCADDSEIGWIITCSDDSGWNTCLGGSLSSLIGSMPTGPRNKENNYCFAEYYGSREKNRAVYLTAALEGKNHEANQPDSSHDWLLELFDFSNVITLID